MAGCVPLLHAEVGCDSWRSVGGGALLLAALWVLKHAEFLGFKQQFYKCLMLFIKNLAEVHKPVLICCPDPASFRLLY